MSGSPDIDNHVRVLAARFGSITNFAKEVSVPLTTASNWVLKRNIPPSRYGDVIEAGKRLGMRVTLSEITGIHEEAA